ncbi:hypothetical protein DUHN20_09630 [Helicobacter pylori]
MGAGYQIGEAVQMVKNTGELKNLNDKYEQLNQYYSLSAQSWKNFGSSNVWQQQTIRQNFSVFRNKEVFVSYAFLF